MDNQTQNETSLCCASHHQKPPSSEPRVAYASIFSSVRLYSSSATGTSHQLFVATHVATLICRDSHIYFSWSHPISPTCSCVHRPHLEHIQCGVGGLARVLAVIRIHS